MKTKKYIIISAIAFLIFLTHCQDKKTNQSNFDNWLNNSSNSLISENKEKDPSKTVSKKYIKKMDCRIRPVDNYHLYYTVEVVEDTKPIERNADKIKTLFYDSSQFSVNVFKLDNSSQIYENLVKGDESVKFLIRSNELTNTIEIYSLKDELKKSLEKQSKNNDDSAAQENKISTASDLTQVDELQTVSKIQDSNAVKKENEIEKLLENYDLMLILEQNAFTNSAVVKANPKNVYGLQVNDTLECK